MQTPGDLPPPRSFSWLRLLRRLLLWLLFSFLLLLVAAFILLKVYEDDIKNYAIGVMNERLATPVLIHPEDIDVTLFSSFPYAAVDFRNMSALDAWDGKKDTLFRAGLIALRFNALQLFKGDHTFRELAIENLDFNLKIDYKGRNNFSIFKESRDSNAAGSFRIKLETIHLSNSRIRYTDQRENFHLDIKTGVTEMSGDFTSAQYELMVHSNLLIRELRSDSTSYLEDKPADLEFTFDALQNTYTIREGSVKLADLLLRAEGSYSTGKNTDNIRVTLKGEEMDIASVLSLLPSRLTEKTKGYASDGDFFFTAEISGDPSRPVVASSFGIRNGTITERESSVTLDHVELNGEYINRDLKDAKKNLTIPAELKIRSFSAGIGGGKIAGNLRIGNFDHPNAAFTLEGSIGLKDLQGLLKIDTLQDISGNLKLNIRYEGPMKSGAGFTVNDLDHIRTSGDMQISDGEISLKNSTLKVTGLNGEFKLQNEDVIVKEFSCKALSSDILLKGECRNLVRYALSSEHPMTVDAIFVSQFLDLNELLANKNEETISDTAYHLAFPDQVNLKLETRIARTVFRQFEATQIKGDLLMRDRKLIMDPVSFKTMDGIINTMLMVDADRPHDILITLDADLQSINVNKLFAQMENFGQDYLTDKHLRGFATADLQLASVLGKDLRIDPDKVYARGTITIERGELIGFGPFLEIADDLKKDVLMREFIETDEFRKKMEHIRFTTLENEIEIRKQKISIPKMEVQSSAMNITFFGSHTFNNEIDYHFSFLLSEVMTKQKKRREEKNKEFGVEEDDGTGKILYYTMVGTTDKYEVKKDYTSKKEKRKEDIKKEKENLKEILKEEFGWFKKDSSGKKSPDPKKQEKFILKWEEDPKNPKKDAEEDEDF
ncbi:MAG: hypothetical protein IT233_03705 [Bacteroidia bacterium]|nr:hypothetical protein [Bacteroidia bacterium]